MPDKLEQIVKSVFKEWRSGLTQPKTHPDEEVLVSFLEGRLSQREGSRLKAHVIACDRCTEALILNLKLADEEAALKVPEQLEEGIKKLLIQDEPRYLEIILKLKDKAWQVIKSTGELLAGKQLVPAPLLRSRSKEKFKDEVTIRKEFKDISVEVRIENKPAGVFNLKILAKKKPTHKIIKELRVSLFKADTELESYLTDTGRVNFEHVRLGKYTVEISSIDKKLASILLDIKT